MSEMRRVAIVMSRMPRLILPDAVWLGGLRACLRRIRARGEILLVTSGTAGFDFIVRGAQRFDIEFQVLPTDDPPELNSLRDQLLIEQADDVYLLGLRKDGNIQQLLNRRLQSGRTGIWLVDLPGLQPEAIRQQLLAAGAANWTPTGPDLAPLLTSNHDLESTPTSTLTDIVSLSQPVGTGDRFLTHTTRACPGPWPRQPPEEYLDRLLDAQPAADHSALMTLLRIISQRQLISSNRTIRGGYPVVSFTAVPWMDLPGLRRFQTHRSHWDFEPYGLSIRREALENHSVRPVCYATEESWKTLPEADRPFFQLNGERSPASAQASPLDWSVEQEWRHLGDLDLSSFTADDMFVFVSNYAEARLLQPHCPWPVTLWPGELE